VSSNLRCTKSIYSWNLSQTNNHNYHYRNF